MGWRSPREYSGFSFRALRDRRRRVICHGV